MSYHNTPLRMAKIKKFKTEHPKYSWEYGGIGHLTRLLHKRVGALEKLVLSQGIYTCYKSQAESIKAGADKKRSLHTFTTTLFVTSLIKTTVKEKSIRGNVRKSTFGGSISKKS